MAMFFPEAVIPVPDDVPTEKTWTAFFRQEVPADLALVVLWLAACITVIYFPHTSRRAGPQPQ